MASCAAAGSVSAEVAKSAAVSASAEVNVLSFMGSSRWIWRTC